MLFERKKAAFSRSIDVVPLSIEICFLKLIFPDCELTAVVKKVFLKFYLFMLALHALLNTYYFLCVYNLQTIIKRFRQSLSYFFLLPNKLLIWRVNLNSHVFFYSVYSSDTNLIAKSGVMFFLTREFAFFVEHKSGLLTHLT